MSAALTQSKPGFRITTGQITWFLHLALGPVLYWLLAGIPGMNSLMESYPVHFWAVSIGSLAGLGVSAAVAVAARRHADARVFLIALGFVSISAIFLLHASSTQNVLFDDGQPGFMWSPPVCLLLGGVFLLLSSIRLDERANAWILARQNELLGAVLALVVVYAFVVIVFPNFVVAGLGLGSSGEGASQNPAVLAVVAVTIGIYAIGAWRYYEAYRQRHSVLLLSILTGMALFAEADLFMAISDAWHADWWLYHVIMLAAFLFVAYGVYAQYRRQHSFHGLFDGVFLRQQVQELTHEVDRLKIEIDELKRAKEVAQITDSDFFQDLVSKSKGMRRGGTPGHD